MKLWVEKLGVEYDIYTYSLFITERRTTPDIEQLTINNNFRHFSRSKSEYYLSKHGSVCLFFFYKIHLFD